MADDARIDALRKRIQKDPGSIAFAQLAEEYRRAGRFQDAIDVCRAGLARHPGYLSDRVTLGRSLLEVGDIEHVAMDQLLAVYDRAHPRAQTTRPPHGKDHKSS